ncbi:MAG: PIG-L family deacetylase [Propionibacteriaceae bacterium]|nr:PIG-L family deacetylase [Propionibacteriaceae bacterium]
MTQPRIELLPEEDFQRVLCVVAHPDDVEYGTSAAIAKWTASGVEVAYLLLTAGEAGMQRPPEVTGPLRAAEQRAACAAVGVGDLTILDHPDGMLVYSLDLRRDIARAIRRFRPEVVVCGSWDVDFVAGLNQADHRAAGLACADAVRDADNTWVFPELAASEGLPKWGTTWLLVSGDNRPTHGVDVTGEPLEAGIASLEAHAGYLADLTGHPSPRDLITGMTAGQGQALGVPNAVLFRAYKLR